MATTFFAAYRNDECLMEKIIQIVFTLIDFSKFQKTNKKSIFRDARAGTGFVTENPKEIVHKTGPPPISQRAPDFPDFRLSSKLRPNVRKRIRASSRTKPDSSTSATSDVTNSSVRQFQVPVVDVVENSTSVVKFGFS